MKIIRFVINFSNEAYLQESVPEWASTLDARTIEPRGFWIGMVVMSLTWLAMVYRIFLRKVNYVDLLMLFAFTFLALHSIRFVVYIGFISAFVGAGMIKGAGKEEERNWTYLASGLFAACILALAIHYGNATGASPVEAPPNVKFSMRMVQVLDMPELHGNVLNSLELGSELVYRAYPRLKPSIDSRVDSYGLDYILFQRALLEEDAMLVEFVQRYDVRYILLDSSRFKIFEKLLSWRSGRWTEFFRDGKEVLLQRSDINIPHPLL